MSGPPNITKNHSSALYYNVHMFGRAYCGIVLVYYDISNLRGVSDLTFSLYFYIMRIVSISQQNTERAGDNTTEDS